MSNLGTSEQLLVITYYVIQEKINIAYLLNFLAELCATVTCVVQGNIHLLNGKGMQVAKPKNGNIA